VNFNKLKFLKVILHNAFTRFLGAVIYLSYIKIKGGMINIRGNKPILAIQPGTLINLMLKPAITYDNIFAQAAEVVSVGVWKG
jgi:hypothetical protein